MRAHSKESCLVSGTVSLRRPAIPQLCGVGVNAREATIGTACIAVGRKFRQSTNGTGIDYAYQC